MEKVKEWEAHTDYIRYVEIHPNRPYILRFVKIKFCNNNINFFEDFNSFKKIYFFIYFHFLY